MTRPLVPLLLFAALMLAGLPAATAAQKQPPKELWDEFPLEPTATPAVATPQATPSPRVVRVTEPDDGMSPGALAALLLAAAGVGALAARTAARRLKPQVVTPQLGPSVPNGKATRPVADPRPRTDAPKAAPHRRAAKPARPSTQARAPAASPTRGAPRRTSDAAPPAAQSEPPAAPAEPTAAPAEPTAAPAESPTPKPKRRAPKRTPAASKTTAKGKRAAPAKPAATKPKRRAAKPKPPAPKPAAQAPEPVVAPPEPPPAQTPEPPAAPPARPEPPPAQAPKPFAAPPPRPEPPPARTPRLPPTTPLRKPAPVPGAWETCRIKLHNRSIKAHFYAVASEGGPVLARSPYFKIRRAEDDPGLSAPEALRALVDQLTVAGWRQTSAGRAPWDLRFERGALVRQPAEPGRSPR
jgi:hypothetical protein